MAALTVREIASALDVWAPAGSKLDFDRVGLQIGDASAAVDRVLVALDLTPDVVDEAVEMDAQLVVTHHPLLFKPLERLTMDNLVSGTAYRLAQSGIAYIAVHTNLDVARGGVSFALARQIGLSNLTFLERQRGHLVKLVTFVPEGHEGAVRAEMAEAGAGRIGDYEACAFTSRGTGHFRPGDAANPFIGEVGQAEEAAEVRVEVEVTRWALPRVVDALHRAHPYEEVAYDLYPVEQPYTRTGLGVLGELPEPLPLSMFLGQVAQGLEARSLRYVGDPEREVWRVAVCGGSGSSLIGAAIRAEADAFVTADVTYHTFFEPLNAFGWPRLALIDAGHYETEWVTENLIVDWLSEMFDGLEVRRTRHRTSPIETFVPGA